jgi:hypothetical protein
MHDKRKKISKNKLILALTITFIIFIIGLVIGITITNMKLSNIDRLEKELITDIYAIELQYQILSKDPCNKMIDRAPLTDELYQIAQRLEFMEQNLGETNKEVIRLKNYYSTLQIKHWLIMKEMKKTCNEEISLAIYFYDIKKECNNCPNQGYILTYLRENNDNFYVYALNSKAQNAAIQTLKQLYNITTTPTIIIDENKLEGFQTKENIIKSSYYLN